MNRILILLSIGIFSLNTAFAQNSFASEVIILNGETFGTNQSNIASYNIQTKVYTVFDSLKTNSVQDIFIEDSIAYIATENKIFSYNLISKTKIAEAAYTGASPSQGALFVDDTKLYVGNWYGQTDDNLYAFNKASLNLEYAVSEATEECGGGLSLNDTLYIGQKIKGTIDGCAPYGCFTDTLGSILVTNANDGSYIRTIDLGLAGAGISQIFSEGNFLFAVCAEANTIVKIEIGTDSIFEEISLAPFTKIVNKIGTKIYLDLNGKAGYFDMADDSFALSALGLSGAAMAYDPNTEKGFATSTDYFSYGKFMAFDLISGDTIEIGISSEAIAIYYVNNLAPTAIDDNYSFIYDENVDTYTLDVLSNDSDPNGSVLTLSNLSATTVAGASVAIVGNKVVYTRAAGIATTDSFTYDACDENGLCSQATVKVTLKSTTSISSIEKYSTVNIFPNPSNGIINIICENELLEVNIFNVSGQKVKTSKESQINLEDINKGILFVAVKTSKGVETHKIILK